MQAFPEVNYRYLLWPSTPLPGGKKEIDMTNSTVTYPMQMLGRADGAAAVQDYEEGFWFDRLREWYLSPELKEEFSTVGPYLAFVQNNHE